LVELGLEEDVRAAVLAQEVRLVAGGALDAIADAKHGRGHILEVDGRRHVFGRRRRHLVLVLQELLILSHIMKLINIRQTGQNTRFEPE
jgi:hypothetical protein